MDPHQNQRCTAGAWNPEILMSSGKSGKRVKPKNKAGKASHRMKTLNHSWKDGKSKDGKSNYESNELGVELRAGGGTSVPEKPGGVLVVQRKA